MTEVIGVRFRTAGKVYYFSPAGSEVKRGSYVIVETARGVEVGKVVAPNHLVEDEVVVQPLRDILRVASREDLDQAAVNRAKEKSAFHVCKSKIQEHNLEMKLIDAEYTFDGSKLLFYFTADGRIDFRDLVKDLAAVFKTRIELRQIGVRDETKILGGIGICGRVLCCHSYLSDFAPVTIKMAKDQNLSLNPTKISGTCGRLMCCLKNEEDTYEELNKHLPNMNDIITTVDGISGKVIAIDVLRQRVRILVEKGDEKELMEVEAANIAARAKKGKRRPEAVADAEINEAELAALMDDDVVASEKKEKRHDKRDKKDRQREHQGKQGERAERTHDRNNDKEGVSRDKARHEQDNAKHEGRGHGSGHRGNNNRKPFKKQRRDDNTSQGKRED